MTVDEIAAFHLLAALGLERLRHRAQQARPVTYLGYLQQLVTYHRPP